MKVKGHKLTLSHNGEQNREESSWTASCLCGWEESHSLKTGAQQEYHWHLSSMKKVKAKENTKGAETMGVTRRDGETWRECVQRYGEENNANLEDMLAEYDLQTEWTSPEWAALKACWDHMACDKTIAHVGLSIKPLPKTCFTTQDMLVSEFNSQLLRGLRVEIDWSTSDLDKSDLDSVLETFRIEGWKIKVKSKGWGMEHYIFSY